MIIREAKFGLWPVIGLFVVCAAGGCKRPDQTESGEPAPESRAAVVYFPESLQPDDASVTAFIHRAIETCVTGDYDAFRMLWSVREDPFPRDAFERGWRSVRRVRILGVQKFRRKVEDDIVYGVHARIELDESVPDPQRERVLLIVREAGEWRLARATERLHRWFGLTADEADPADAPAATRPTAHPPTPSGATLDPPGSSDS
ncbi:MAG: hypothetical protein JSV19_03955 [Phycisphaerales bacterium]|nr:MAG: hypothetical protein JSV19_03955 [Phycisphaerales bacterium]